MCTPILTSVSEGERERDGGREEGRKRGREGRRERMSEVGKEGGRERRS